MPHRHHNGLKTAVLFGLLGGVVLVASYLLFGRSLAALTIGLVIALAVNLGSYWFSDSVAIRAMRARPVTEAEQPGDVPDRPRALDAREPADAGASTCRRRSPRTPSPPAGTPGTRRSAARRGSCELLDERELRGVLGHELMHVYNRDMLTSSVAAALSSVITYLAYGAMLFGGGERPRQPRRRRSAALLMLILGPIAASVVQMAISRTREYDADEDGATLTGDPLALASALRKLEPAPSGSRSRPSRSCRARAT